MLRWRDEISSRECTVDKTTHWLVLNFARSRLHHAVITTRDDILQVCLWQFHALFCIFTWALRLFFIDYLRHCARILRVNGIMWLVVFCAWSDEALAAFEDDIWFHHELWTAIVVHFRHGRLLRDAKLIDAYFARLNNLADTRVGRCTWAQFSKHVWVELLPQLVQPVVRFLLWSEHKARSLPTLVAHQKQGLLRVESDRRRDPYVTRSSSFLLARR